MMNWFDIVLGSNLINALGWTIVHSLWQGGVIAFLTAIILLYLYRKDTRYRYITATVALLVMLYVSVVTFVVIYKQTLHETGITFPTEGHISNTESENLKVTSVKHSSIPGVFDRSLPVIALIWISGIFVLSVNTTGGLVIHHRLRSKQITSVPIAWQIKLISLCRSASLTKPVQLLQSAIIDIPLTIGHFKPLILVPIGYLTRLPAHDIEAILSHEIAHICRRDYFINILQTLVDIIFFYHPAIRWISRIVRREREYCCDDFAVSLCGNKQQYIKALVKTGELTMRTSLAMAISGQRFTLYDRIKRLITPGDAKKSWDGMIGIVSLLLLLIPLIACVSTATGQHPNEGDIINASDNQSSNAQPVLLARNDDDSLNSAEEKVADSKGSEDQESLEQERKRLDKEISEYEKQLDLHLQGVEELEHATERHAEEMHKHNDQMKLMQIEMKELEQKMSAYEIDREKLQEQKVLLDAEMKKHKMELLNHQDITLDLERSLKEYHEKLKSHATEIERIGKIELSDHKLLLRKHILELIEHQTLLKGEQDFINVVKSELMEDNLIDDKDDFHFKLTSKELTINTKRQSEDVFTKYKKIFEDHKGEPLSADNEYVLNFEP